MKQRDTIFAGSAVTYAYGSKTQRQAVLDDVDFAITQGEFICLSGPSGSGKSTLLNLLGLIEPPQDGQLTFRGRDVKTLTEPELNKIRRHEVAFVFQDFQIVDVLTVEENVEYFLTRQGVPAAERRQLVAQAISEVGLSEFAKKRPSELSGGQRQRVAIARALAKRPAVIIADEPTASLDATTGRSIMQVLKDMATKHAVTIVMASHDPMVLEFVSRVIKLRNGKIVSEQEVTTRVG